MSTRLRVGISSCLLGQKVRYDGGDKRDTALVRAFGRSVEWVPVCPEVEAGLGVPREPIQLVRRGPRAVRLIGIDTGKDYTAAMRRYAKHRLDELAMLDLCGYVFKEGSPSCGLAPLGLFAAALVARFPHLPVEEEGRLRDARVRDAFIERVVAYARLLAKRRRHR